LGGDPESGQRPPESIPSGVRTLTPSSLPGSAPGLSAVTVAHYDGRNTESGASSMAQDISFFPPSAPIPQEIQVEHEEGPHSQAPRSSPARILSQVWSAKALPTPGSREELMRQLDEVVLEMQGIFTPEKAVVPSFASPQVGWTINSLASSSSASCLLRQLSEAKLQMEASKHSPVFEGLWEAAQAVTCFQDRVDRTAAGIEAALQMTSETDMGFISPSDQEAFSSPSRSSRFSTKTAGEDSSTGGIAYPPKVPSLSPRALAGLRCSSEGHL
jgi:hypothetical protein